MNPTFATLLLGMLASALVVGSMVGLRSTIGGVRSWAAFLGAASVVGRLFSSVVVYVAIQRNVQGSVIDETGAVDYAYLSALFFSWLLAAQIAASLVFATILVLAKGASFLCRILLRRVPALRALALSSWLRRE